SPGQDRPIGRMAAFPPGAVQERRRCALFWAVSTCGCAAADAQFHAQEIRRAHLWARFANGARIEILDLSSAGALERNWCRAIPRTRGASDRVPRRQIARDDRRTGGTNAKGCRENGFRKSR